MYKKPTKNIDVFMLRDIKIKQTQEIVIKNTFMNSNLESDEPEDKKPRGSEKRESKNI
jgi:hypothetical protein